MATWLARLSLAILTALAALAGAGCQGDGHFALGGYTTQPNYDCGIRTVYVPIFQNVTFSRGLEFQLTRAVIREIEAKTPYKVVSNRDAADSELLGKIVTTRKSVVLMNQLNEVREAEALMGVELVWRDLRPGLTGKILSGDDPEQYRDPLQPPLPGAPPAAPPPALVQPQATFIPELGGSITTARKQLVDRTATQIVSLMEQGW